jgi:integrase
MLKPKTNPTGDQQELLQLMQSLRDRLTGSGTTEAIDHPDLLLTIREAFEKHYDQSELSPNSRDKMKWEISRWERFMGAITVGEIDNLALDRYRKAASDAGLAPRTVNSGWQTIRSILRCLASPIQGNPRGLGIIEQVPWMRPVRHVRQRPKRIHLDELGAVYNACHHATYPNRGVIAADIWRAFVVLAYFTGMRKGDLLALPPEAINFERGTITFRASKTWKESEFALHPVLAEHLRKVWSESVPLILRGLRKRTGSFYKEWKRIVELAGVPYFTPHDIRRTAASEIERIQKGLGRLFLQHAGEGVSEIHYLNAGQELDEAILAMRFPEEFRGGETIRVPLPGAGSDPITFDAAGWRIRPGAFGYRGHWFYLTGCTARVFRLFIRLNRLETYPISSREIVAAGGGKTNARQVVHELRGALRAMLKLPDEFDPVPCVERGDGGVWQINLPEWIFADWPAVPWAEPIGPVALDEPEEWGEPSRLKRPRQRQLHRKTAAERPELLTKREVAEFLKVKPRNLDRFIAPRGPIVPVQVGRRIRFTPESLQEFVREAQKPKEPPSRPVREKPNPSERFNSRNLLVRKRGERDVVYHGEPIPPFNLSGDWIEAYDVADVEGVKIEAIRQQRQAGRFQADRLAGIDAEGRIWRRVRVNVESPGRKGSRLKPSGRVSFWYLAATLAIANGGAATGREARHGA